MDAITFYINFGGFYGSFYGSMIEDIIENDEDIVGDEVDYKKLYKAVAEHIFDKTIEFLQDTYTYLDFCSTTIKYNGLISPKYYNYSTDRILATVDGETFNKIRNFFNEDYEEFVDFVDENSKSVSGFISFYEGFDKVYQEPAILLEYIFDYLNQIYKDDLESTITENIYEVVYTNI